MTSPIGSREPRLQAVAYAPGTFGTDRVQRWVFPEPQSYIQTLLREEIPRLARLTEYRFQAWEFYDNKGTLVGFASLTTNDEYETVPGLGRTKTYRSQYQYIPLITRSPEIEQRPGFGAPMMKHLISEAVDIARNSRKESLWYLVLDVYSDNPDAIKCYKKFGFVEFDKGRDADGREFIMMMLNLHDAPGPTPPQPPTPTPSGEQSPPS